MLKSYPPARAVCTLLSALLPIAANAVQLDYDAGVGIEHNDNVNLSETDPISSNILIPSVGFTLNQQGSTIQANANGFLEYRDYLGSTFSDEFRGQLSGRLDWIMLPERLKLTVEDYLGEDPINTLQPNTPNNIQQTNVFAVGPTLSFHFGPTVRGQAELRYINSYADHTDEFNTNRVSAALRAIKDLTPSSAISANLLDEHVEFTKANVSPNYDHPSAFGRYTRQWTRLYLTADAGYSWLRYSGNASDRSDPLVRANLGWQVDTHSSFTLNLAHQLSDAASSTLATQTDLGLGLGTTIPSSIVIGSAAVTSDTFLENRIDVGYGYRDVRNAFTVAPLYRKLAYVNGTQPNQVGRGGTLTYTRLLRPLLTFGLNASQENLTYPGLDRTDRNRTLQAYMERRWSLHWISRVEYTHYTRDSNVVGQNSTQNIIFASLTYTR